MSETEFELLGRIIFCSSTILTLKETLKWEDERILDALNSLYDQGLIKIAYDHRMKEIFGKVNFIEEGDTLFYLATKKG